MKWAFRNKTAEKRLKMAIFKLLVLSYMLTTLYLYPRHLCGRVYSFRFSVRLFVHSYVCSFVSSFLRS